ncbi:MAG TPA: PfkB family carbohydrate kinase, partial [Dehalococcoidia bacterium]|nr:PfkB family carbohydrate kinase [Dehalococcoidia bacterium]
DFKPVVPEVYRDSRLLFLANMHPEIQLDVLQQMPGAELTMMDTMNFWIEGARDALVRTMARVDIVTMNEAEARMLTGKNNLITAAGDILRLGPKVLLVKKGEYGAVMFSEHGYFVTPAYPLEEVKDPTGAGDSFAGGFLGYLDHVGRIDGATLRQAVVIGSAVASFTVGDFSVGRLKTTTQADIRERLEEFRQLTFFEPVEILAGLDATHG